LDIIPNTSLVCRTQKWIF